jgi:hypothetical protein
VTTSVQPLSSQERKLLVDGFQRLKNHPGRAYAELIYRTGIHPVAISQPLRFDLHSDGANLRWIRPKNRAKMELALEPALRLWFDGWFHDYEPCTREHIYRLIRQFGNECHIHGLGPRALRHTFLRRLTEAGFAPDEVARMGGCTVRIAIEYARMVRSETNEAIAAGQLPE